MAAFRIFRRLAELLDVSASSPADGQVLTWNNGTSRWEPDDAAAGGSSGAAGGVLSGTYPDPGFAVDMATQAEQDAAIAALSSVYQPLDSDLTAIAALTTTSFGRGLLALANAAALRTAAGLGTAATSNTGDFDAAGAAAAAQAASQPLDSDLTAIAALSTTSFGRGLLALADAAALRSSAGLGTAATSNTGDFDAAGAAAAAQAASQPLDSDLTSIAALTTTSYGRGFLALADAAAGRTALGLGTLATQSGTFSGTSSGTNTGDQTSVSGNAGTATALQTGRTIDGQTFDGTANITVIAPGTHAATGKTTPVDADELAIVDSAASNVLKKLTWANLKATLKTYLDTLYQALDSELTALAGLTSASDKLPYFTGSGTAATTTLSSFIRTLIDDADAATARNTLGASSLLGVTSYNPAGGSTYATTSATYADVDATNLTVTFTAPASGNVLVSLNAVTNVQGASTTQGWNLRSGSSDVTGTNSTAQFTGSGLTQIVTRVTLRIYITGLTPGASVTYKWGFARTFGSATCQILVGSTNGAAVMEVWSA